MNKIIVVLVVLVLVLQIRLWVGDESGRGAMKARAEKEGATHYHAHVAIGGEFRADHQLWVEVESADGTKSTAALTLHRE